ncbi:hypothetical protein [Aegicerativicinus sediminis]|uniref:hypothetical protein n=1 Tax=Aegicerativicinus sediminis TaxID=2893202 RepID=UPI001E4228CF|nr:hypothetical protein [Aegicerativicinus sediminis]
MFKKTSLSKRIELTLILGMAFVLLLGSNLLDRRHFKTVQHTVNSVFKDRVVVQDYIYRLNNMFHDRELVIIKGDYNKVDDTHNKEVEQILIDFKATELTAKESNLLEELHGSILDLKKMGELADSGSNNAPTLHKLQEIKMLLDGLAEIQLEESGQMTHLSNQTLGMNSLMSKLEIAFMVLTGISILALIVYPNPIKQEMV